MKRQHWLLVQMGNKKFSKTPKEGGPGPFETWSFPGFSGLKFPGAHHNPQQQKKYALVKFRIAITTWTPLSSTSRHHAAIICFAFGNMTSESVRKHDDGTSPM